MTVTGTGGSGKTRSAVEVATRCRHDFADGVSFVDLSSVAEPDLVEQALFDAVGAVDVERVETDLEFALAAATSVVRRALAIHSRH